MMKMYSETKSVPVNTDEPHVDTNTGTAGASDEAKRLIEEIDKMYAQATQSKLVLLDIEEAALKLKVDEEIRDCEVAAKEKEKIETIYAQKRLAIESKMVAAKRANLLSFVGAIQKSVESDPYSSEADKRGKIVDILKLQLGISQRITQENQRVVSNPDSNEESKLEAQKQIADQYSRQIDLIRQKQELEDNNSFIGSFGRVFAQMQNEGEITFRTLATTFKNVFDSAISSISNGITGLIMGTLTWGQALQQIGMSILQTVIQAIVQMGVRWVLTQIMMAVMGKSILAASTAATAPFAAAASAIWATPATLATIATYGTAADSAPAFIASAEGIVAAQSVMQFEKGGLVPAGQRLISINETGKPEYVLNDRATAKYGEPFLNAMNDLSMPVPSSGRSTSSIQDFISPSSPNVNVEGHKVSFAMLNSPSQVKEWMMSAEGRATLVDLMSQGNFKTEVGIQS